MLAKQARIQPQAIALEDGKRQWTFQVLNERVNRLAHVLLERGVQHGDRVAILSGNSHAYVELQLAAARIGAMAACLNWRLTPGELSYCIGLVTPKLLLASPRHVQALAAIDYPASGVLVTGEAYEAALAAAPESEPSAQVDAEDGLIILFTSGTTGLPKGAVISHRAMTARMAVYCAEFGVTREDGFLAFSPMFHMGATDFVLGTLMLGGKVIVHDGLDIERVVDVMERNKLSRLPVYPGMMDRLLESLRRRKPDIRGLKLIGSMPDLASPHQIAELTTLVQAPYWNTFGSTETAFAASGNVIPVGEVPTHFSKRESAFCELRLVDAEDRDVPDGTPGEMLFRGPTLFSGYWNNDAVNAVEFRGGWFHTGDVFVRHADGSLHFMDRRKYLIKSGGENIYPAEIERVILADPSVSDAVVVRRADARWGEVPVAFVARNTPRLTTEHLFAICRSQLAGYKQPKEIRFVELADFPRATTGKIQRHEVEKWL